jgi:hypothetical protein
MIGAGEISELARTLELAAKAGDLETVRNEHDSFLKQYETLLHAIRDDVRGDVTQDDEVLEFSPAEESDEDEALEFSPADETGVADEDEALEFAPADLKEDKK